MRSNVLSVTRVVAVLSMVTTGVARAEVLMTAAETPGGVLLSGAGTLNLSSLTTSSATEAVGPFMNPGHEYGVARVGNEGSFLIDSYAGVLTGGPFGTGGPMTGTSGTGDVFGPSSVEGNFGVYSPTLIVPEGYVSGSALSGTGLFAGESFASLGITPGVYTWTWGAGVNADSLTLSVVPEPVGISGLAVGSALVLRRRIGRRP